MAVVTPLTAVGARRGAAVAAEATEKVEGVVEVAANGFEAFKEGGRPTVEKVGATTEAARAGAAERGGENDFLEEGAGLEVGRVVEGGAEIEPNRDAPDL